MRWSILFLLCSQAGCVMLEGACELPGVCELDHCESEAELLPVPPVIPRELTKTTLRPYTIEPPDILRIEVARLVPRSPYFLTPGDGLLVQVAAGDGTVMVDSVLNVELDGTLQFGPPFDDPNNSEDPDLRIDGPINVGGLSLPQARELITTHVAKTVASPGVRVTLNELGSMQQISGEHLVAPDGSVNLGSYGQVHVAGLTVEQARQAVNSRLNEYLQMPNAFVDVYAYNSKRYYVILQGAGLGDRVVSFPVTGNETVLDALSNVEGLSSTSSEEIWLARPGRNSCGGHQILPVNWRALTELADTSTNYQLLPGDRLFVREDSLIAFDTHLGKLVAPLERMFGVTVLGTDAVSRLVFFKQQGQRGGF